MAYHSSQDKILKSNELNFQIISTLPMVWLGTTLLRWVAARFSLRRQWLGMVNSRTARAKVLSLMRTVNERSDFFNTPKEGEGFKTAVKLIILYASSCPEICLATNNL